MQDFAIGFFCSSAGQCLQMFHTPKKKKKNGIGNIAIEIISTWAEKEDNYSSADNKTVPSATSLCAYINFIYLKSSGSDVI